jgi:chemotaxis protein MotB
MADGSARPIIIVKKKAGHGGHHGGAWKVAYADFVTAMMALFIVLWLLNSSKQVQDAVGGYFRDPSGTADKKGSSLNGSGQNLAVSKDDLSKLKEDLQKDISSNTKLDKLKDQVEMTITSEGLRIELLESEKGTFFDSGSSKPSKIGAMLLGLLAQELGKLPNKVSIEGHTDSKPFAKGGDYGNWELSSDRANAARRLMQHEGLSQSQVMQVRGFADQKLRKADLPLDASNRRITLIVQYIPKESEDKVQAKPEDGTDSQITKPAEPKPPESSPKPAPQKE